MDTEALKEKVIACLRTIYDPELPVNIYELGLIYEVNILPLTQRPDRNDIDGTRLPGGTDPACGG